MNEVMRNRSIDQVNMFQLVTVKTKDISGSIKDSEGKVVGLLVGWPNEGTQKAYLTIQPLKKMDNYDTFHIVKIVSAKERSTTFLVEEVL